MQHASAQIRYNTLASRVWRDFNFTRGVHGYGGCSFTLKLSKKVHQPRMDKPALQTASAAHRLFLGMLTQSSKTIFEPVSLQLINENCGLYAHSSRFTVTEIFTNKEALVQFETAPMFAVSNSLAVVKAGMVFWNLAFANMA